MNHEKYVHIAGVGNVRLYKSKRAKRIHLRVKPQVGVELSVPYRVSYQQGIDFLLSKKEWLQQALQKVETIENSRIVFGPDHVFSTRKHTLKMRPENRANVRVVVRKGVIHVCYPATVSYRDEVIQQAVYKGIMRAWRLEAELYLPARLATIAQQLQLPYNGVSIKATKSRWGSCSYNNHINLSLFLMKLPNELIDYVLVHELAHTIEKNHSAAFWNLVEKLMPGARKLDKELNNYQTRVW